MSSCNISGAIISFAHRMAVIRRTASIDWFKGCCFSPTWSADGKLIGIYSETNAAFRDRMIKSMEKMKWA